MVRDPGRPAAAPGGRAVLGSSPRASLGSGAVGALLLLAAIGARAAGADLAASPHPRAEAARIEAYLDGLVPALCAAHHVPGAVVTVFDRDGVVVARGYGLADVERRRPMDPAHSLVRIASLSKLFVTTLVLQLAEEGALDLHADVASYLDFPLPSPYDEPVTLHELLTHTAGFDDRFLGSAVPLGAPVEPLESYLARRLPPIVMRPGRTYSYSNHGMALAGLVVQRVAGMPYERLLRERVLEPLGMRATAYGVPDPVPEEQARPYVWRDGRFRRLGFDRHLDAPAGDVDTTALELTRFAVAHLAGGRVGDARILSPRSEALMQGTRFRSEPRLPGMGYGFHELVLHGVRGVGHGGWVLGFHSQLVLLPARGVGFFLSLNAEPTGPFERDFLGAMADLLVPRAGPPPSPPAPTLDFAARAAVYAGTWLPSRRVRSSWMELLAVGQHLTVERDGSGGLELRGPLVPPTHWVEVEPGLLQRVDEPDQRAALRDDPDGPGQQLVVGGNVYDRVQGLGDPRLHALLWAALALLGAGTLAGLALGAPARALLGAGPSPMTRGARLTAAAAALLLVVPPAVLVLALTDIPNLFVLWTGVPWSVRLALWHPLALAGVGLLLVRGLLAGFRPDARAPLARLHYLTLTAGSWLAVASWWSWHVRGPWSG